MLKLRVRTMAKSEFAFHAGVSLYVVRKWIKEQQSELVPLGYRPTDRLLSPIVVKHLCERYAVELYDN